MKTIMGLLSAFLLVPSLLSAQAVVTHENYVWYWDHMVWDDADTVGCVGEPLVLTGPIHVVLHGTTDRSGAYHYRYHYQPQGIDVVGMYSGDLYLAVGVTQGEFKVGGVNDPLYIEGYINNAPIVKPGTGFVLNVVWRFHVTINPNGDETAYLEVLDVRCK